MLEQFALIDLSVVKGSVMGACQRLHTLLLQNSPPNPPLSEPDDINFIVQAINNYMMYAEKEKGLGTCDNYNYARFDVFIFNRF
jgi:hypothetical protein